MFASPKLLVPKLEVYFMLDVNTTRAPESSATESTPSRPEVPALDWNTTPAKTTCHRRANPRREEEEDSMGVAKDRVQEDPRKLRKQFDSANHFSENQLCPPLGWVWKGDTNRTLNPGNYELAR